MALENKDAANYREATGSENCGICRYMNDDGTCQRVEGIVDRDHVCDLFEASATANSESKSGGPMAESQGDLEVRAKYTQAQVDALGAKGHAFGPDDDGHYSYPIDDLEDLRNAIHAVGRGNADHDAIRKYVIKMAGILSATDQIPDNWNSDGSLKDADAKSNTVPAVAIRGQYGRDDNGARVIERRVAPRKVEKQFELREVPNGTGGTDLLFNGFASVTCLDHDDDSAAYEMEDWLGPWTESILAGSFRKTITEGCDTAFLINHDGMTLARTKSGTMKLSEQTEPNASPIYGVTGLYTEARLDPQNSFVQNIRSAVERGDLDEMSFAFRVMRQEWSESWDRRWIGEVSLDKGDTSLVNYGANPHTGGTVTLRQKLSAPGPFGTMDERLSPYVLRLRSCYPRSVEWIEKRIGAVLSAATKGSIQEALDHLHSADDADLPSIVRALQDVDTALDAGQASLAQLLGVNNPDGDAGDQEPALDPPPASESKGVYLPPANITRDRLEIEREKGK